MKRRLPTVSTAISAGPPERKPLRVAIVSRIYRPEPAAASIYLGSVADALLSEGQEVDVYTSAPPAGLSAQASGETIRTTKVLRDKTGYARGYLGYMSFDIPLFFACSLGDDQMLSLSNRHPPQSASSASYEQYVSGSLLRSVTYCS